MLTIAAVISNPPTLPRVPLDTIPLERAKVYHGQLVRCTFPVTCPPDTHGNVTVVGTGWNAVERGAHLPKDLLVDKGDEVTAVGILEVIRHKAAFVNGQLIPPFEENRLSPCWRVRPAE